MATEVTTVSRSREVAAGLSGVPTAVSLAGPGRLVRSLWR